MKVNKTKKLRNGPVISVDPQIELWRARLKKKGILLGKHMKSAVRGAEWAVEHRKTNTVEKLNKKTWF